MAWDYDLCAMRCNWQIRWTSLAAALARRSAETQFTPRKRGR
jgi:hypothetical protein